MLSGGRDGAQEEARRRDCQAVVLFLRSCLRGRERSYSTPESKALQVHLLLAQAQLRGGSAHPSFPGEGGRAGVWLERVRRVIQRSYRHHDRAGAPRESRRDTQRQTGAGEHQV